MCFPVRWGGRKMAKDILGKNVPIHGPRLERDIRKVKGLVSTASIALGQMWAALQ